MHAVIVCVVMCCIVHPNGAEQSSSPEEKGYQSIEKRQEQFSAMKGESMQSKHLQVQEQIF